MADAARSALQSMTGFGRASQRANGSTITVELRSTNHRYLEVDQRLPNGYSALQGPVAELIRTRVRRGRIEATVMVQGATQRRVAFDEPLLRRYYEALMELKGRFGLKGTVTLDHLLALPQALNVAEDRAPAEQLGEALRKTAAAALQELIRSRRREGAKLAVDLRRQLQRIEQHLRAVKRRMPKALKHKRLQLRRRLLDLIGPGKAVLPAHLEQAAALAKEADVHEEMVRLESHVTYMRQSLSGETLVGKRLDFIAQELMREANTMGAKLDDPQSAHEVVEIKGCIEKIREQVLNLE